MAGVAAHEIAKCMMVAASVVAHNESLIFMKLIHFNLECYLMLELDSRDPGICVCVCVRVCVCVCVCL